MNTKIFEMLIERTDLRNNSKAEIIQLNRNEKAFIDEDKKSIELAETIFEESSMFCFHDANYFAMDYILHKLISDRKLFDEMKDRGTSVIRLFSLLSMYEDRFNYSVAVREGRVTECGIFVHANDCLKPIPLEYSILVNPSFYLECTVFNDNNPVIRNRLARDLTKDKTKLDIFVNGILAIKSSDLVLSCINTVGALNGEARNYVNRLQKSNMLDKILNKDDTALEKLALKELLKLSILQSTKLESPQASSVGTQQYSSIL
ncbi:hypothetical protein Wcon_00700 [Wolbachia endosymbiont of Cylisticus convexus]|uniref:hypothetical protein n=1 Tax=Wolbachia endosymbiont of Cylisticus convexus TaxID=118728 RepID=UPI000DF6A74E|nr:hypothetical protein [Wolbachia endosymbiont of Cylisticus convexus]RDD35154.1 hypothetical protein Wcon_00700 [Wolbachia endosymbiont of Cylisticus convexus]